MTSDESPYARFRRALETENLVLVRAAAAELPRVSLGDALTVCVLLADQEPERYDRAALRWLARFSVETPSVTMEHVALAADALALLRRDQRAGLAALQSLTSARGLGA